MGHRSVGVPSIGLEHGHAGGINGMGRIGRLALRAACGAAERRMTIRARATGSRSCTSTRSRAERPRPPHLLAFDSVQGRWRADIAAEGEDAVRIAGRSLGFSAHAAPGDIPWGDLGRRPGPRVQWAVRHPRHGTGSPRSGCAPRHRGGTGQVRRGAQHRRGGQRAPVRPDAPPHRHRRLVHHKLLAPVVKVVHEAIGIRHGQITTIHDPTNTNGVVDAPHKDLRRARSGDAQSLQPTTTGSATAIALIYPELKGKLNGHAVRAPVLNASVSPTASSNCSVRPRPRRSTACSPPPPPARWPASSAARGVRWSAPITPATPAARSSTRCPRWSPTARC